MRKQIYIGKLVLFLITSISMLSACTTSQRQQQAYQTFPAQQDALDYYRWILEAEPETLYQERTRLEQAITEDVEEQSLVQLAVLISATASDPVQEQRALDLLDQLELNETNKLINSNYRILASLWRQVLEPRLQSYDLREQIDALTSIEQQLNRREQQGG